MNLDSSEGNGYAALEWLEGEFRRLQADRRNKVQLLSALRRIVESWEQTGTVNIEDFLVGRDTIDQVTGHKAKKPEESIDELLDEVRTTVDDLEVLRQNPLIGPQARNLLTKAIDRLETTLSTAGYGKTTTEND